MKSAELYNGQKNKKLYYSISEVSELTGLEQHVIRYWESEFPKLKPRKNRAGNRQFRDKDIQIIRYIKHLLQNDMYTIQGAKKKLMESGYKEVEGQMDLLTGLGGGSPRSQPITPMAAKVPAPSPQASPKPPGSKRLLDEIKTELKNIVKLLD